MREGVEVIIQNSEGKYLLQMRDSTEGICNPLKWSFFGGNIEDGEPLLNAAREIKEELDIAVDVKDMELVGYVRDANLKTHVVKYNQKIEWSDFHLHEGAGAGYFTKEEILRVHTTKNAKSIVEKYL